MTPKDCSTTYYGYQFGYRKNDDENNLSIWFNLLIAAAAALVWLAAIRKRKMNDR